MYHKFFNRIAKQSGAMNQRSILFETGPLQHTIPRHLSIGPQKLVPLPGKTATETAVWWQVLCRIEPIYLPTSTTMAQAFEEGEPKDPVSVYGYSHRGLADFNISRSSCIAGVNISPLTPLTVVGTDQEQWVDLSARERPLFTVKMDILTQGTVRVDLDYSERGLHVVMPPHTEPALPLWNYAWHFTPEMSFGSIQPLYFSPIAEREHTALEFFTASRLNQEHITSLKGGTWKDIFDTTFMQQDTVPQLLADKIENGAITIKRKKQDQTDETLISVGWQDQGLSRVTLYFKREKSLQQ